MGRNTEKIRMLTNMLNREQSKRWRFFRLSLQKAAEADQLRAELDAAVARIAEMEARPAAPSVEQVAELLLRFLDGHVSPDEALLEIFPRLDRDPDTLLLQARERMEFKAS